MKKLFIFIYALLCVISMHASKADPEPQTIRQSDGSFITVIAHGDEFGNYVTALDGALLVAENEVFYIAETTSDGTLKSSGVLAHEIGQRTQKEKDLIAKQDLNLFATQFEASVSMRKKESSIPSGYFPHIGTPKTLVVLVEFQDSTFRWNNSKEIFDEYLNAETLDPELADGTLAMNYKSVAEYFNEMSFGQFRPQFDVVGPIKMPKALKSYGAGNDNVSLIVTDAMTLIKDSADLKQYDQNNDGYIDLVYFICASYSQSSNSSVTELIWPKVTTCTYDTGQGVKTQKIGLSCELNKKPSTFPTPHVAGIGLFCHEFSHTLGMPDLYATANPAKMLNQTYEYWDLMDGGEYTKNGNY
ncbi:MAG: M6 family metalloprotease domain-containing protein, partial [Bacteroidales bacterium]|nr:M6 family metalloprotease domain-containing protein [Bacteroidales bacterium]